MYRTYTYTAKLRAAVHMRLTAFLEQQRLLYNAALEERIDAYRYAYLQGCKCWWVGAKG